MGLDLTQLVGQLDAATDQRLRQQGQLVRFDAAAFVSILEAQIQLAAQKGLGNMQITMARADAEEMLRFMRRGLLLGA